MNRIRMGFFLVLLVAVSALLAGCTSGSTANTTPATTGTVATPTITNPSAAPTTVDIRSVNLTGGAIVTQKDGVFVELNGTKYLLGAGDFSGEDVTISGSGIIDNGKGESVSVRAITGKDYNLILTVNSEGKRVFKLSSP